MNFNGNTPGDFADGGIMTGSLEITDDLTVGDSITLDGKYTLPITAPVGANNVIVSDGTDQLVWTGDLSVGDVSSITTSTLDGEIVLFNGTGGKSIKNSAALLSSFITNPLDRTSNDAAASEISVRKAHGLGGYVQNGDQISRYSSSAFRQLGSIYAYTGWHQWEATEDHINSSGSKYSVWSTDNGQTLPVRKLEIDTDGISILDTLRVKSGVVAIDGAVNSVITHAIAGLTKWQIGAIGSDNYEIRNTTTLNTPITIDAATDKISTSGEMKINDNLELDGSLFMRAAGVDGYKIVPDGGSGFSVTDSNDEYYLSFDKDIYATYNYSNGQTGSRISNARGRGTTYATRAGLLEFDRISEIIDVGTDSAGGQGQGGSRFMICDEDWTAGNHGTKYQVRTTDRGNITPLLKLEIGTDGVTINGGTDTVTFPKNRGLDKQVLTTDGAGLATWANLPHTFLGEIYTSGNTAQTIISNIGQYVPPAGAFIQSYNQGFLPQTSPIFTYFGGGERIFKVDSSFSFRSATGGTSITWSFALFRNGALLPGSIVEHQTSGTTDIGSDTITNLVTLSNGDFVAVRVANLSSTVNCVVKHLSYNIIGLT